MRALDAGIAGPPPLNVVREIRQRATLRRPLALASLPCQLGIDPLIRLMLALRRHGPDASHVLPFARQFIRSFADIVLDGLVVSRGGMRGGGGLSRASGLRKAFERC